MNTSKFIPLVLCTIMLAACAILKKNKAIDYHLKEPPNGVKVGDNLYCDQSEITNFHWMEYIYWIERVYGAYSYEYLSAIPDTLVWFKHDTCLAGLSAVYFTHPRYRDFPVVGITQFQAMKYSKWRSDRVMERILVKNDVLEWDTNQTAMNHFTIFKYFTGNYKNKAPDPRFMYYPHFRLPNTKERGLILAYADSIENHFCTKDPSIPQIDIIPCVNDSFRIDPTVEVYTGCTPRKAQQIYHLKGNVSEWGHEQFMTFGSNWTKNEDCSKTDVVTVTGNPNAWTGFRNVCDWRKFELR